MRPFLPAAFALLCLLAPPVAADAHRDGILQCIADMETGTTWDTCRTRMFAPCAVHAVGSDDHLACLSADREGWRARLVEAQSNLTERLTPEARNELTGLMGQWFGYVGRKCAEVGASRADISEEAAQMGCEISETAGLISELERCEAGKSTAPYCIIRGD